MIIGRLFSGLLYCHLCAQSGNEEKRNRRGNNASMHSGVTGMRFTVNLETYLEEFRRIYMITNELDGIDVLFSV